MWRFLYNNRQFNFWNSLKRTNCIRWWQTARNDHVTIFLLQFVSQRPLTAWILHQFEKPNEFFFIIVGGYNLAVVKACLPFAITVRWISLLLIYTVLTLTSDFFHQLILPTWKISYLKSDWDIFAGRLIEVCHEVGRGFFENIYAFHTFERFLTPYCTVFPGRERGDHICSPRSCI